ncbi:ribosomal protein L1/ribosomal biogenesis protein [Kipferlia bialata]|uniref:Ribosomal protein L1/ribosomal biogenesis protein n=1 Tax=Kipferlia bialata TaxID=797122 RepID=A0A9K3CUJ3_9EUKA|nr:ribosomal protein L1/ribosomal biogenesis protein [Kipferlia bialata]|eukprot:g3497.t1
MRRNDPPRRLMSPLASEKQCQKATTALKALFEKKKAEEEENGLWEDVQPVQLMVTLNNVPAKRRAVPFQVVLPNVVNEDGVCLFVSDGQYDRVLAMKKEGKLPRVGEVVSIAMVKGTYEPYEARRQLLRSHSLFLADDRVLSVLTRLLGSTFLKAKRFPQPISVSDAKIASSIEECCRSIFVDVGRGPTLMVRVGTTERDAESLGANVFAALKGLTKLVGGKDNVRTASVRYHGGLNIPLMAPNTLKKDQRLVEDMEASSSRVFDTSLDQMLLTKFFLTPDVSRTVLVPCIVAALQGITSQDGYTQPPDMLVVKEISAILKRYIRLPPLVASADEGEIDGEIAGEREREGEGEREGQDYVLLVQGVLSLLTYRQPMITNKATVFLTRDTPGSLSVSGPYIVSALFRLLSLDMPAPASLPLSESDTQSVSRILQLVEAVLFDMKVSVSQLSGGAETPIEGESGESVDGSQSISVGLAFFDIVLYLILREYQSHGLAESPPAMRRLMKVFSKAPILAFSSATRLMAFGAPRDPFSGDAALVGDVYASQGLRRAGSTEDVASIVSSMLPVHVLQAELVEMEEEREREIEEDQYNKERERDRACEEGVGEDMSVSEGESEEGEHSVSEEEDEAELDPFGECLFDVPMTVSEAYVEYALMVLLSVRDSPGPSTLSLASEVLTVVTGHGILKEMFMEGLVENRSKESLFGDIIRNRHPETGADSVIQVILSHMTSVISSSSDPVCLDTVCSLVLRLITLVSGSSNPSVERPLGERERSRRGSRSSRGSRSAIPTPTSGSGTLSTIMGEREVATPLTSLVSPACLGALTDALIGTENPKCYRFLFDLPLSLSALHPSFVQTFTDMGLDILDKAVDASLAHAPYIESLSLSSSEYSTETPPWTNLMEWAQTLSSYLLRVQSHTSSIQQGDRDRHPEREMVSKVEEALLHCLGDSGRVEDTEREAERLALRERYSCTDQQAAFYLIVSMALSSTASRSSRASKTSKASRPFVDLGRCSLALLRPVEAATNALKYLTAMSGASAPGAVSPTSIILAPILRALYLPAGHPMRTYVCTHLPRAFEEGQGLVSLCLTEMHCIPMPSSQREGGLRERERERKRERKPSMGGRRDRRERERDARISVFEALVIALVPLLHKDKEREREREREREAEEGEAQEMRDTSVEDADLLASIHCVSALIESVTLSPPPTFSLAQAGPERESGSFEQQAMLCSAVLAAEKLVPALCLYLYSHTSQFMSGHPISVSQTVGVLSLILQVYL